MFKREDGYLMQFVFVLIVLFGIFAVFSMNTARTSMNLVDVTIDNEKSLYYAEAGLNRYLYFLNADELFYLTEQSKQMVNKDIPFEDGYYRLQVFPPTDGSRILKVRSTGWVENGRKVTVEGEFTKDGFPDYVFGTNSEQLASGQEIWWADGDIVNGNLHTNGTLYIQGRPIFNGRVSYSTGINIQKGSNPQFNSGPPIKAPILEFPPTDDKIKNEAIANGYYFRGRTCIMVRGDRLIIRDRTGKIENRPLPPNGVIYVDSINNSIDKFGLDTGNVFISGELDGRLTIAAKNNIYITGYDPTKWEHPEQLTDKDRTKGIVYAKTPDDPECDDMLGLIAGKNVEILHYGWLKDDGGWPESETRSERIGMRWRNVTVENDVAINDINIHAAIFTLNGSFGFEKYDKGPYKGYINFVGSMFQNRRGAVGLVGRTNGYSKNYTYDERMRSVAPPNFIEPENAKWYIRNWGRISN